MGREYNTRPEEKKIKVQLQIVGPENSFESEPVTPLPVERAGRYRSGWSGQAGWVAV